MLDEEDCYLISVAVVLCLNRYPYPQLGQTFWMRDDEWYSNGCGLERRELEVVVVVVVVWSYYKITRVDVYYKRRWKKEKATTTDSVKSSFGKRCMWVCGMGKQGSLCVFWSWIEPWWMVSQARSTVVLPFLSGLGSSSFTMRYTFHQEPPYLSTWASISYSNIYIYLGMYIQTKTCSIDLDRSGS